ncbi:enoyl-CoA hydratase/isomerase family protein [Cellulophaga sp. L1A9]|uniref:enoyl-CoA hydratase/isomerase family protein n=1 Tax=Cellulophaga sp. L1A9 TaxID=2686362 RepID=UPI00131D9783|nr:enoyl-CoA hydratase/isomerase family protein [Cellulophaga sp. L1A9]
MATSRPNGSLYTHIENKVATLEFGHPASNSFVSDLLDRLAKEFTKLSDDKNINVIILKSEGDRAFCAGASFDELVAVSTLEEGKIFFSGFANVINAMRTCSKIIVGRIQGKTVGGGVGLAAACDIVYATESASIRLSELTIGIAPFVIAPAVERKMGTAALSELSLRPTEWKTAYWAQEKGLFAKVYESISELDKELEFYTNSLSQYNPQALEDWKNVLWENTDHWDVLLPQRAAITGKLALSEFTKNTLEKFKK